LGCGEFGDVWVAYILRIEEKFNGKKRSLLAKTNKESKHIHDTLKILTIINEKKKNSEKVAAKEAKGYD
jgi:hypothetical protein